MPIIERPYKLAVVKVLFLLPFKPLHDTTVISFGHLVEVIIDVLSQLKPYDQVCVPRKLPDPFFLAVPDIIFK
jgi:hypothetical protein